MALFLITSVCDEGVYENDFKVVEAESRTDLAQDMLDNPYAWEHFLRSTAVWWDLTYYEYKYGEPIGWSAEDLLERIDATHVDGDSEFQVRIYEIKEIEKMSPRKKD